MAQRHCVIFFGEDRWLQALGQVRTLFQVVIAFGVRVSQRGVLFNDATTARAGNNRDQRQECKSTVKSTQEGTARLSIECKAYARNS